MVKVPCPVSTGGTRRLGSVKLTVVISALVSSFKLPRSGVEVQDAAGLPLLNLGIFFQILVFTFHTFNIGVYKYIHI